MAEDKKTEAQGGLLGNIWSKITGGEARKEEVPPVPPPPPTDRSTTPPGGSATVGTSSVSGGVRAPVFPSGPTSIGPTRGVRPPTGGPSEDTVRTRVPGSMVAPPVPTMSPSEVTSRIRAMSMGGSGAAPTVPSMGANEVTARIRAASGMAPQAPTLSPTETTTARIRSMLGQSSPAVPVVSGADAISRPRAVVGQPVGQSGRTYIAGGVESSPRLRAADPGMSSGSIPLGSISGRFSIAEARQGTRLSSSGLVGVKAAGRGFSMEQYEQLLRIGPPSEAASAASFLMGEARLKGNPKEAVDVYVRLYKAYPDWMPDAEEVAAMLTYGLLVKKLPIADLAMRHLAQQEPNNPLINRRLPDLIAMCAEFEKDELGMFWVRESRARGIQDAGIEATMEKLDAQSRARKRREEDERRKAEARQSLDPSALVYDGDFEGAWKHVQEIGKPGTLTSIDMVKMTEGLARGKKFKEAFDAANRIPVWFPDSAEAAQGLFIAAWISHNVFKDPPRAMSLIDQIEQFYPQSRFVEKGRELRTKVREGRAD